MTVTVQFLFDQPQQEIASLLRDRLNSCVSASVVSGFVTAEGIRAIGKPIRVDPGKLKCLVVGAGTYRAYEALDDLVSVGVDASRLHVHLGHSQPTGHKARHPFIRYHPMLHSKVWLLDMGDGRAVAFVGSHNLTGFALLGLNGEAGVLLSGPASAPEFVAIQNHIDESVKQAIPYDPTMKEAYSWWTTEFFDGLCANTKDIPRDAEMQKTIVVIAAWASDPLPKDGEIIYFEIPDAFGDFQSLQAEVHIYIFATLPSSPGQALTQLASAKASLSCKTEGLEMGQGGVELRADWYIDDRARPELKPTPNPFRPKPPTGMRQVRVQVRGKVDSRFEYLFDTGKKSWAPIFDENDVAVVPEENIEMLGSLNLAPRVDMEWYRVSGLEPAGWSESNQRRHAPSASTPQSGAFILMSQRRRKARVR